MRVWERAGYTQDKGPLYVAILLIIFIYFAVVL